jgi:RNA polymerase sigma-70 factor (ECF subfamily)
MLWLREVEGYSYQELAEMLAIPLGTVRSRLFAAREELRRVWKTGE